MEFHDIILIDSTGNIIQYKNILVAAFMIFMGIGIPAIWTIDIIKGTFRDQGIFFHWKNEGGDLMWPHIFAEYSTGILLLVTGIAILTETSWANKFAYFPLGALAYTSLNSLGWTFVMRQRYGYAVPMAIGLIGSVVCVLIL